MNLTANALPRRYPGLKPFERSQQSVFHGRQDDVQRLSNLILRERLVVLFAKSGIGKTSLLQAGVAPELERHDFVPVLLRTDHIDRPILDNVVATLSSSPERSGQNDTGERPGKEKTLWELLKRLEYDLNGLPATPVLVFDQFEETFTLTHSDKSRSQFLNELADLANATMPDSLRNELLQQYQAGEISIETMQWWEQQPELRIVLSIRSDFLHTLDRVSERIPGILRNRYQLLPLDRDKARTAIIMPASADGAFCSPTFRYAEPALQEMIDFLAGNPTYDAATGENADHGWSKKDEIEAVNLQIICMDVEERIIDYQKNEGFEVEPGFYEGKNGLQSSIRNFYANQLDIFPKAYVERMLQKTQQGVALTDQDKNLTSQAPELLRQTAQLLIEENLITPGDRRNSVVDDTLLDTYDITLDFLDTLVDKSRLLRKEPRLDDFYYEISHDTLLPAIIESRNQRRAKDKLDREKADYEAKLAEEARRREAVEAELRTARRQRKLARMVAIMSFLTVIAMLAFGVWYVRDFEQSVKDQLKTAEANVYIEQYDVALSNYQELASNWQKSWVLLHLTRTPKNVEREEIIVDSLYTAYAEMVDSLEMADSLMLVNRYALALSTYKHAISKLDLYRETAADYPVAIANGQFKARVNPDLIQKQKNLLFSRKDNALQTLIREFKISQRDYEVFNEARVWGQALRNLQNMESLLPHEAEDQTALQKELQLNMPVHRYVHAKITECQKQLGY